jgi:hypothetical protein
MKVEWEKFIAVIIIMTIVFCGVLLIYKTLKNE